MIHTCRDMVVLRKIEDLRLMLQASERLTIDNAMDITLKLRPQFIPSLFPLPPSCPNSSIATRKHLPFYSLELCHKCLTI